MNIFLINKFFYPKGGAESCFFQTIKLLQQNGHSISTLAMRNSRNLPSEYSKYFVSSVEYNKPSVKQSIKAMCRLLYSWESRRNTEQLFLIYKPNIAHLHNIYHQISPSILHSLKKFHVPVVMTLHDYKLICASYSMITAGKICEACKYGRHYHCFLKKCAKDSRVKSLLNTIEMYLHHKILHIYDLVDVFISPSRFLKNKAEEMGFKGKIEYLPNFVCVDEYTPKYDWRERSIVYCGRLSKEKGLLTLIDALKLIPDLKLKLIGEGLIKNALATKIQSEGIKNIALLGYKTGVELEEEIRKSMFAVIPSEWYENNPRSVIEAFALGKPVVGSRIGGIPELVRDGETGYTFEPFNATDLAEKIRLLANKPAEIERMGRNARKFVEEDLNADKHYEGLMRIYQYAIDKNKKK